MIWTDSQFYWERRRTAVDWRQRYVAACHELHCPTWLIINVYLLIVCLFISYVTVPMPFVLLLFCFMLFIYVHYDCIVCANKLWQCCIVCSHANKAIWIWEQARERETERNRDRHRWRETDGEKEKGETFQNPCFLESKRCVFVLRRSKAFWVALTAPLGRTWV